METGNLFSSYLSQIKSDPISQRLTSEIKQLIENTLQGRDEELPGALMKIIEDFFKGTLVIVLRAQTFFEFKLCYLSMPMLQSLLYFLVIKLEQL